MLILQHPAIIILISLIAIFITNVANAETVAVSIPPGTATPGCELNAGCYQPSSIYILQSHTVEWENDDTAAHTVTSGTPEQGQDGTFDSGMITPGQTFAFTFPNEGTFPYFCLVHPWMTGSVTVNPATGQVNPPYDLVATAVSSSQINLLWYPATNAEDGKVVGKYEIQVKIGQGQNFRYLATTTEPHYAHKGLSAGTYMYRVIGIGYSDTASPPSKAATAIVSNQLPHNSEGCLPLIWYSWNIDADTCSLAKLSNADLGLQNLPPKYIVPLNGAQISYLGNVDFNSVTDPTKYTYSSNMIGGSDRITPPGTVMVLKSDSGKYAKIRIEDVDDKGMSFSLFYLTTESATSTGGQQWCSGTPQEDSVEVEDYAVAYESQCTTVESATVDILNPSLVFDVATSFTDIENDKLIITIPRSLLDAKDTNGNDVGFNVVLNDAELADYEETSLPNKRILSISIPAGVYQVEIIGTQIFPSPDSDGDGITNAKDGCPDTAEDLDNYQDSDGCPEENPPQDTDKDGIPDPQDICINTKETFNEYQDEDGCPDEIPNGSDDIGINWMIIAAVISVMVGGGITAFLIKRKKSDQRGEGIPTGASRTPPSEPDQRERDYSLDDSKLK